MGERKEKKRVYIPRADHIRGPK